MSAHCCDGSFSGNAGAGGAFVEHHCYGLAGQAVEQVGGDGAGFEGGFVRGGISDEGGEFTGREVCD